MLAPILLPDPDAMLRHLTAVFGGAGEGLVELAWTDPETRRLAHAQMFATDRLSQLVERAAGLNRTRTATSTSAQASDNCRHHRIGAGRTQIS